MSLFGGSTNPSGVTGFQPSFTDPSSYIPSGMGNQSWRPGSTNDGSYFLVSQTVNGNPQGETSRSQTSQRINNLSDVLTPIDPKTGKPFTTETSKPGFFRRMSDAFRGRTTTAPTDTEIMQKFNNSATSVGQAQELARRAVEDYRQSVMHNQNSFGGSHLVTMPDGSIQVVPMSSVYTGQPASLGAIPSLLPPKSPAQTSQATQSTINPISNAVTTAGTNMGVAPTDGSRPTATATGDRCVDIDYDTQTGYSHCAVDLRAMPIGAYSNGQTLEAAARDADGRVKTVFTFRVVDSTNGTNGITFMNGSSAGIPSGAFGSQISSGAPGTAMLPKRWEGPKRDKYAMYDFWRKTAMEGKAPYNVIDQLVHTGGAASWSTLGGDPGITDGGAERLSYAESLMPHIRTEFGLENDPQILRKLCCWGGECLNEGHDLATVGSTIKDFAKTMYSLDPLTDEQKAARRSVYGPAMTNQMSGANFLSSNMDLTGKNPIEISRALTSQFYSSRPDKSNFYEISNKDTIADFRKQGHDHWARLGKSAHEMSHADWISANVRMQAAKHFDDSIMSRYDIPKTPLADDQRFLLSTQKTDQSLLNANLDDATIQSLVDQAAKSYGWKEKSTGGIGSYLSGMSGSAASTMSGIAKAVAAAQAVRSGINLGYNLFYG